MRVLIVRLGAFGDIIHTLPLAADLHAAGHEVGWACEDRWQVILAGSPVVGEIHPMPRQGIRGPGVPAERRILALRRYVRSLRARSYDAVIDAQGLAKSALISALCRIPRRIGHARPRARELSWVISRRRCPVVAEHIIDQQRALALPLLPPGVRVGPWRFPLPPWDESCLWAERWLERQGFEHPWMLNVGAGWPTKVWPRQRQTEFLRLLRDRRQSVLLVWGSPQEHDLAEEIAAHAGHGQVAPPTSIPQLAGLLLRARVLISGDTGPLHLALALEVPAVGLFGPVPALRNGPRGPGYRNLQAPGAAWERTDVSKVDMSAISAEAVRQEAIAAIADRHRRSQTGHDT